MMDITIRSTPFEMKLLSSEGAAKFEQHSCRPPELSMSVRKVMLLHYRVID